GGGVYALDTRRRAGGGLGGARAGAPWARRRGRRLDARTTTADSGWRGTRGGAPWSRWWRNRRLGRR
ncbi:MAG TPA: hypothetical protein VFA16_14445, partial [Mycobacterium sp.]|uniref:hypothetical protein n=1 Tax=Mycobacterium sp. TaxID=1785 RepID=UPI002D7421CF